MKKRNHLPKLLGTLVLLASFISALFLFRFHIYEYLIIKYSNDKEQEKAFVNAKWKMSIDEVQKANDCLFEEGFDLSILDSDLNLVRDRNRFTSKVCSIFLWGSYLNVDYHFFDNKLYRIDIRGTIDKNIDIDSLVSNSLSQKWRSYIKKDSSSIDKLFQTNEVELVYGSNTKALNDAYKNIYIKLTYRPIVRLIKEIGIHENSNVF